MSIKDRLAADANAALKSGDKPRLGVLRTVRAQVKNAEISKHHPLSDDETIDVLVSAVKARRESLTYAQDAQRQDLAEEAQHEIRILEEYLPQPLTEAELETLIVNTVRELGAASPKDMGRVMSALIPHVKGRVDGKLVSAKVSAALKNVAV